MKSFLVLLVAFCVVVSAEPPIRRYRPFQGQRLEQAPYPAAGIRPSQEFRLPARLIAPQPTYGPPAPSYGPPPADANPDASGAGTDQATTEQATTTEAATEEADTETEPPVNRLTAAKLVNGKEEEAEEIEVEADDSKKVSQEQPQQENFYYIILPTGQLQKVQYVAEAEVPLVQPSAAYSSSYQYQFQSSAPFSSWQYYVGNNAPLVLV